MLFINYSHPLHGMQEIKCEELINKEGLLHAVNIHGVTFQTLEPDRISIIRGEGVKEKGTTAARMDSFGNPAYTCYRCEDSGRLARYGRKEIGEPNLVKSFCTCEKGQKLAEGSQDRNYDERKVLSTDLDSIQIDDYIEGLEDYGEDIVQVRGWVRRVSKDKDNFIFDIQADDGWHGARGTTVFQEYGKVKKLEPKERP